MRTRQLFRSDIQVLEEERIQRKKDLRAQLKDQKKRSRRSWTRATMTELRREVGLHRYLFDGIFECGGQLTEVEELEMYWYHKRDDAFKMKKRKKEEIKEKRAIQKLKMRRKRAEKKMEKRKMRQMK